MMRVRLATITEVECRKAVHGKGKVAIRDWLGGPAFWLGLAVAYRAGLVTDLCGGRWCVRGRGFIYTNGVSSLRNERRVVGGTGSGGLIAVSTLAVGRGLQILLWKKRRDNRSPTLLIKTRSQVWFIPAKLRFVLKWFCGVCRRENIHISPEVASVAEEKGGPRQLYDVYDSIRAGETPVMVTKQTKKVVYNGDPISCLPCSHYKRLISSPNATIAAVVYLPLPHGLRVYKTTTPAYYYSFYCIELS